VLKLVDEAEEFHITHADANTFRRDLQILLRFWELRWAPKKTGQTLGNALANYRNMLMRCFETGSLFLLVLWKGETPVAARAAFLDGKKQTFSCFVIARDSSVERPPPGFLLNMYSIRWAIQNGFTTYDLLQGNHSYKYEFGPEERRIESIWVRTGSTHNLGGKLDSATLPVALKLARDRQAAGRLTEAEFGYRQILAVDPRHPDALRLLGQIKANQPSVLQVDFAKALEFHKRGKLTEAEQIYRAILAADPGHFDAMHLCGVILLQRGQFAAAEQQIARAILINPDFADAHNNLGAALNSLGRFEEALTSFDRALKGLGRSDEALASYDKAIALRRDYPDALKNRGNLLAELKRREEAHPL
jgi:Flp pilus assembly protein TadD